MTSEHGTVRASPSSPAPGELIGGRYELLRGLPSGTDRLDLRAEEVSFEARDQESGEHVRLTLVTRSADDRALARYRNDVDRVRTLGHPGAVAPRAIGTTGDGRVFVISDLVEGVPLDVWLAEHGPFDGAHATELLGQVLQVLTLAHEQGVIHREIKPSKLVLVGHERIKLNDLGTVLALTGDFAAVNPHARLRLGVPTHTAPELLTGDSATPAADVYSLGLTLAEMLTGRPVVEAPTVAQAISRQLSLDPEVVAASLEDEALAPIVRRALSRDPTQRFPDAREMLVALEEAVGEPTADRSAGVTLIDEDLEVSDDLETEAREDVGGAAMMAATPGPLPSAVEAAAPPSHRDVEAEVLRRVTASREAVPAVERRGRAWLFIAIFLLALGAAAAAVFWPGSDDDESGALGETGDGFELVVVGDEEGPDGEASGLPGGSGLPGASEPTAAVEADGARPHDTEALEGAEGPGDDGESAEMSAGAEPSEPPGDEQAPGGEPPSDVEAEEPSDAAETSRDEVAAAEPGPSYRARVRITSDPSRARLDIDGEAVGRTPWEGVVESDEDSVVATLGKRGHRRGVVRIDLTAAPSDGPIERRVELTPFDDEDDGDELDEEPDDSNPFGTINRMGGE